MFGVNDMEITLYFVGRTKDEAQQGLPFDCYESANDYRLDTDHEARVYKAQGLIDFTTMEKADL